MILGIVFLLVGLGMLGGSIIFALWRRAFLNTALSTTGVVLASGESQERRHNHGGGIQIGGRYERWYYPVVRFQTN